MKTKQPRKGRPIFCLVRDQQRGEGGSGFISALRVLAPTVISHAQAASLAGLSLAAWPTRVAHGVEEKARHQTKPLANLPPGKSKNRQQLDHTHLSILFSN